MLLDRIPSEAELQPDLDVGTPLGVELPRAELRVFIRIDWYAPERGAAEHDEGHRW